MIKIFTFANQERKINKLVWISIFKIFLTMKSYVNYLGYLTIKHMISDLNALKSISLKRNLITAKLKSNVLIINKLYYFLNLS